MKIDTEKISNDFLEISSEQRLNILFKLQERESNISKLAEILEATKPEIHRNVTRLVKSGLILKNSDGNYYLTTYGKTVLIQIPTLSFISDNKKYFENHNLEELEKKFIQRLGALQNKKEIKGFVMVLEKWKKMHDDADKYICNILSEVPYSKDIMDIIESKLEKGIIIQSIFSDKAIISESRKTVFEEKGFQKFVIKGNLKRKIMKNVSVIILVTDKEAGLSFVNNQGEPDLSTMFTSSDVDFHDWCLDYFKECWNNSSSFHESMLKK